MKIKIIAKDSIEPLLKHIENLRRYHKDDEAVHISMLDLNLLKECYEELVDECRESDETVEQSTETNHR